MELNYWAVLVSAVASMVVGSFWYGPAFGRIFSKAIGMDTATPEQKVEMMKGMWKTYLSQFVASVVLFSVLGWLMAALAPQTIINYLQGAFWVWLGFVLPVQLGRELWGGKMTLFWLGAGNMAVTLAVGAVIFGVWR